MKNSEYFELVSRAKMGDLDAMNTLSVALTERLRVVVKHRVWAWPAEEQADLVQTSLSIFLGKLHEIRGSPAAFAIQILANQIGNELQRKRRRTGLAIINDPGQSTPLESGLMSLSNSAELASADNADRGLESREQLQLIIRTIDQLKPFCRVVFKGMIEDRSIGDIWEAVLKAEPALSRSAFDKRIYECRKRLRDLIQYSS